MPSGRAHPSWTLLALVTLGTLAPAGPGVAPAPRVSDGAGMFGDMAVAEADDIIRHVREAFGRDVMVETFAEVPSELKADLDRDGKEKFFDDWLNCRAKALGVHGVFVLIVRNPGRVQVGVDRATRRRAFTDDDREALREMLVGAFRMRQFDEGLLDGLRFVRRRIEANTSRDRCPSVPVGGAPAAL